MAKVGDQFVITIDSKMTNHNGNLYTANGMSTCVFDDKGLEKLTPYRKGMNYKQGLIDGIDAMYSIMNMSIGEIYKCFKDFNDAEELIQRIRTISKLI